jgi:hypothetical protein
MVHDRKTAPCRLLVHMTNRLLGVVVDPGAKRPGVGVAAECGATMNNVRL